MCSGAAPAMHWCEAASGDRSGTWMPAHATATPPPTCAQLVAGHQRLLLAFSFFLFFLFSQLYVVYITHSFKIKTCFSLSASSSNYTQQLSLQYKQLPVPH